ncbi:MAG TPA: hypothetical protein VD963_06205 [Phycisphaerales bacterium]|nr:hypothetical protein [Phycisphaerales bacterium]
MTRRHTWMGWAAGTGLMMAPIGLAQESRAPAAEPPPGEVGMRSVLVLEKGPLEAMFVDEKDARLKAAILMLRERLAELPGEIPDMEPEAVPFLNLVADFVYRPMRLAVTYNPADQTPGGFGIGAIVSLRTERAEEAGELHRVINAMLTAQNVPFRAEPSTSFAGMSELMLPVGVVRFGPRQGADGPRFEVHAGSVADPELPFRALPAGAGFEPVLRGRLDVAPLTPLVNMLKMFAAQEPEAAQAIAEVEKRGFIGPNAVKYSFSTGYTADASVTRWVAEGARRFVESGMVSPVGLEAWELAVVPADAVAATVGKWNHGAILKMVREGVAQQPEAQEHLAEFRAHTGVDLVEDLLGSFGGASALYMSDATGGGLTLGSVALAASVADRARLEAALTKLAGLANQHAAVEAHGYVRVRTWTHGGSTLHSLTFPGVPIPLEVTIGLTDRWLVAGLSPQAAVAAALQASGKGGNGFAGGPAVKAMLPAGRAAVAVSFIDIPRTMGRGYPFVAAAGSMVANAARSAKGAEREPGMVVPLFSELRQGAKPRVAVSYWEGDNLVYETRGNRSQLVEAAGVAGAAAPVFPVIAALVAGAAGAARAQALDAGADEVEFEIGDETGMDEADETDDVDGADEEMKPDSEAPDAPRRRPLAEPSVGPAR